MVRVDYQGPRHAGGEEAGGGARNEGPDGDLGDVAPPGGSHEAQRPDLDTDRGGVGKPAQCVGRYSHRSNWVLSMSEIPFLDDTCMKGEAEVVTTCHKQQTH